MNEDVKTPEVMLPEPHALSIISKAEIDVQISTAKAYPRSIVTFKRNALEMATLDEETAASMFFSLPRGKNEDGSRKIIEGPSVRLAEVVGSCWGNLRYGARIIEITDKQVVAQGTAFDLERNLAAQVEVRRSIVGKRGRFNEDMITVTGNAAMSVALRNAIFKVVPFAYVKPVLEQAKLASIGKALTMEERRKRVFDWFAKELKVSKEQVLKMVGRKGPDDVTVEDLVTLRGIQTAIADQETTWAEVWAEVNAKEPSAVPTTLGELTEKLKQKPADEAAKVVDKDDPQNPVVTEKEIEEGSEALTSEPTKAKPAKGPAVICGRHRDVNLENDDKCWKCVAEHEEKKAAEQEQPERKSRRSRIEE